jgi:hypothetical protein
MSALTQAEREGWLAQALTGETLPVQRARMAIILAEVLDAGGPAAEAAFAAACDTFRRIDARARGATREEMAAVWGPAPGQILSRIESEGEPR